MTKCMCLDKGIRKRKTEIASIWAQYDRITVCSESPCSENQYPSGSQKELGDSADSTMKEVVVIVRISSRMTFPSS